MSEIVPAAPLSLRTQVVRFVLTGGFSAVVDFGLLQFLHEVCGLQVDLSKALSHRRHHDRLPDQPALDVPGRAEQKPVPGGDGALRVDLRRPGRDLPRSLYHHLQIMACWPPSSSRRAPRR